MEKPFINRREGITYIITFGHYSPFALGGVNLTGDHLRTPLPVLNGTMIQDDTEPAYVGNDIHKYLTGFGASLIFISIPTLVLDPISNNQVIIGTLIGIGGLIIFIYGLINWIKEEEYVKSQFFQRVLRMHIVEYWTL